MSNTKVMLRTRFVHNLLHILLEMIEQDRRGRPTMSRKDVGFWTDKEVLEFGGRVRVVDGVGIRVRGTIHGGEI